MKELEWLEDWYSSHCDGDWEHQYGVEIATIDNPGWSVTIDLVYTDWQDSEIEYQVFETSGNDWYGYRVENGKFIGSGDPKKLTVIINAFRQIVEEKSVV